MNFTSDCRVLKEALQEPYCDRSSDYFKMDDMFSNLSPTVSSTQDLDLDFLVQEESKEGYEDFNLLTLVSYLKIDDEKAPPEDPDSGESNSSSKSFAACKVCGDKASGYHYGVTSCEGCKGFFRRSIQKNISYKCLREKHCLVSRTNRNRCQYCRFRKCLYVGMSKDSVRYGRVPKKSRVKGTESSKMYDIIVSIAEAHQVHCSYTEERTRSLVRKPALFSLGEQQQLDGYPGSNLELQKLLMWQHFATMLSPSIPQVVEFAKRIPGFSDLHPDDQLACVKFGFFEVWCVYAARLARDGTLSFSDGTCLNAHQLEIIFDRDFVNQIFGFMQWLNELQLNDTEIAMFSAMVLLNAERGGVSNPKSVQQLQSRVTEALQLRETRLPGLTRLLLSRLGELRALGLTHSHHLSWFRQQWPHLRLPALFAEVFDIPARPADMSR